MEFSAWHLWMIGAILLLILEIFTVDFLFAAFASACVGAGISAALGAGLTAQTAVFAAVATVALAVVRPAFKRCLYRKSDPRKSNADALVGLVATVLETTGPGDNPGRVKLGGEEWRAVSDGTSSFAPGDRVQITSVSGSTLTVRPASS